MLFLWTCRPKIADLTHVQDEVHRISLLLPPTRDDPREGGQQDALRFLKLHHFFDFQPTLSSHTLRRRHDTAAITDDAFSPAKDVFSHSPTVCRSRHPLRAPNAPEETTTLAWLPHSLDAQDFIIVYRSKRLTRTSFPASRACQSFASTLVFHRSRHRVRQFRSGTWFTSVINSCQFGQTFKLEKGRHGNQAHQPRRKHCVQHETLRHRRQRHHYRFIFRLVDCRPSHPGHVAIIDSPGTIVDE